MVYNTASKYIIIDVLHQKYNAFIFDEKLNSITNKIKSIRWFGATKSTNERNPLILVLLYIFGISSND